VAWFVAHRDFANPGEIRSFRVQAGILGEKPTYDATVNLRAPDAAPALAGAQPFVSRPSQGVAAYAYFDGELSRLVLVDPSTGDDRELLSSENIIHAAALDVPTDSYFVLVLGRASRGEMGLLRGALSGGEPTVLVAPRETEGALEIHSQLFVSPNGSTLVTYDCRDHDCRLRAYDATSGAQRFEVVAPASDVVGITDSGFLLSGSWSNEEADAQRIADAGGLTWCRELPCPIVIYSLIDGSARSFGAACGSARLADAQGQGLVVGEAATSGCSDGVDQLVTVNLAGEVVSTIALDNADEALVVDHPWQTVAPPAGWALLTPDGVLPPRTPSQLIHVTDGVRRDVPRR
jgi:hypothetical protein